jgi:hypothetical protein
MAGAGLMHATWRFRGPLTIDGRLYFTDLPLGLPKFLDDPRKELLVSGVYSREDGRLRLDRIHLLQPGIRP